jgi:hypothetical protein
MAVEVKAHTRVYLIDRHVSCSKSGIKSTLGII